MILFIIAGIGLGCLATELTRPGIRKFYKKEINYLDRPILDDDSFNILLEGIKDYTIVSSADKSTIMNEGTTLGRTHIIYNSSTLKKYRPNYKQAIKLLGTILTISSYKLASLIR